MMRVVFHIDMDAFFSSIEQLSNPNLRGKPVIVCGDPEGRSVVSTASYEARKYGIKSGMPVSRAKRLCPNGVFVEGNPQKYVYTSIQILETLREFTSLVEPFSVDEAFLEFYDIDLDETLDLAKSIKRRIREKHSLTCSVGVGPNKIVAKMASDVEKPDGLTIIWEGEFLKYFGDKPVEELWGVGPKTASKLKAIGLRKVKHLAMTPEPELVRLFGAYGTYLWMTANGKDESPLIPYYVGIEPKSIGHEYTLPRDTSQKRILLSTLLRLCEQVGRRVRKEGYLCDTIVVKIRKSDFKTITRQKKIPIPTDRDDVIYRVAKALFLENFDGGMIRLIGVSARGLRKKSDIENDSIFSGEERQKIFVGVIDSIRDKFGEDAIRRCGSIRF